MNSTLKSTRTSTRTRTRLGATLFALWGLLHIAGGGLILLALKDGAAAGYSIYGVSGVAFPAIAGAVLGYLAFGFIWVSILVIAIAWRHNRHNSEAGLMLNTALTGMTELGLLLFLVQPGYVSWLEASPGLLLFGGASIFCGIACRAAPAPQTTAT